MATHNTLLAHFVSQAIFPSEDKEVWLAAILLREKYPNVTYTSLSDVDGVYQIVDYVNDMIWDGDQILRRSTGEVLKRTRVSLHYLTTSEICYEWMALMGETNESKLAW